MLLQFEKNGTRYVMESIHQYEYRDFIYEFFLFLFELSGQTISRIFIEQALICPLDSIGRH